jgi:hypothetical protein
MTTDEILKTIRNHIESSRSLGLTDDVVVFEYVADCFRNGIFEYRVNSSSHKAKNDKKLFLAMTENQNSDWSSCGLDESILSHKDNIAEYWKSIAPDDKSHFTIFELNVIMYLISNNFTTYVDKGKQDIIRKIDRFLREADNIKSLESLKV